MLRYYCVEENGVLGDLLFAFDYDSGFFKQFNPCNKKWVTPAYSFIQIEHDYDTDFVEISRETAMKLSNGLTVDEEFKAHLAMLDSIKKK